ncbi:MAG: hypothetical protein K9M45_07795 [Kiritimatiellales bacterium]|nr:hypothetical protein [Kiritimatiellales bacterium]
MKAEAIYQVVGRHKARGLSALEEVGCPSAYLDVIRKRFDYLKTDLLDMANDEKQSGNMARMKGRNYESNN